MERIFSVPVLTLATWRDYSQSLSSHCPHGENILSSCLPIGHMERIFSVPVLPLPTWREYSQSLPSHWPHGENILSPCLPIGHMERIFSVPVLPLATWRENSSWSCAFSAPAPAPEATAHTQISVSTPPQRCRQREYTLHGTNRRTANGNIL
jgi:hypothetical protein